MVFLGISGQLPADHLKLHHCLFIARAFYKCQAKHGGAGFEIINLLVVCYSLLYFDIYMIALIDKKKSVLLSATHFVGMKDVGNIFSCHYFCGFSLPSSSTDVRGDTEKENPSKTNLW